MRTQFLLIRRRDAREAALLQSRLGRIGFVHSAFIVVGAGV